MALAADITTLRDRVLADLNAAHDYYTDTKIAWDIVGRAIADGRTFSIRNMAKASRDVLVHNRGVASKTYEFKVGNLARYKDGQRIEIPEHYHRETWELIRKVVTDISNAAIAKAT